MVAEYGKDAYGGDIKKMWQKRDAMSPTGKQGESFDIAQAALFLASDESKYISGTHLIVDGSITATMLGTVKPE